MPDPTNPNRDPANGKRLALLITDAAARIPTSERTLLWPTFC